MTYLKKMKKRQQKKAERPKSCGYYDGKKRIKIFNLENGRLIPEHRQNSAKKNTSKGSGGVVDESTDFVIHEEKVEWYDERMGKISDQYKIE